VAQPLNTEREVYDRNLADYETRIKRLLMVVESQEQCITMLQGTAGDPGDSQEPTKH
jgi:hypothetical protein